MHVLPIRLKIYIGGLAFAAALILLAAVPALPLAAQYAFPIIVLSFLVALADLYRIVLWSGESEITVSVAFRIAAILLLPLPLPVFVALLGTALAELRVARPWFKKLFNVAMMVVIYMILMFVFTFLGDGDRNQLNTVADVLALFAMMSADYVLNIGMVTIAIAFASAVPVRYVWRLNFEDVSLHYLMSAPSGAAFALLWKHSPLSTALILAPLFIVRRSFELMVKLRQQTEEALRGLTDALDARDGTTSRHSARVSDYARRLALHMQVDSTEVETITWAARLHDLGKIGISDTWLFKPDSLTAEETREFQQHVAIGADIARRFPIFGVGSHLIRCHHEHYDGSGYPAGLAGEEIPLGGRIIAVVDAFDAMTSDRPYREALTPAEAIQTLRDESGSQFDPKVVGAFIEMLHRDGDLGSALPASKG